MTDEMHKKDNGPTIHVFIKPHCFIKNFKEKYEKVIYSIFLPEQELEEKITSAPQKKFSNKEEMLTFLDGRVTGCIGKIGVLCEQLSKTRLWFTRKEYLECIKEIEETAFGLGALYVARDIIEGDGRMNKKGYSIYHQSIENFLVKMGYVKDDKSQGEKLMK